MNRTAPLFLLLLMALPFASCKKFIEKKQEQAAIEVISNGRWKITSFNTGSTDQLSRFDGYLFQFNPNETVDAYYNGNIQASGSWAVDVNARTVSGNFGSTGEPLSLLNGTWHVLNTSETSVDAEQTIGAETRHMHMDKQ
jgi:hypothetical protein